MSREQFNCQQTHLKFNTTYRSRSGSLMDCSPRAFFPALPTPPSHNRREATPGEGRRGTGAGAGAARPRKKSARTRRAPRPPAIGRSPSAAPRSAAPQRPHAARKRQRRQTGRAAAPAPAAPQPPPEPRPEPPAHGSRGASAATFPSAPVMNYRPAFTR